jgi:hypothetical protein
LNPSLLTAAFAGFALVARRPGLFGLWMLALGIPGVLLVWIYGMLMMALPSGAGGSLLTLLVTLFLLIPSGTLLVATLGMAIMRSILKPEAKRFGFLRLGDKELKLTGLMLAFFLLGLLIYFLLMLLIGLVTTAAGRVGGVILLVGAIGVVVLFVYFGSRLCYASPLVLMKKRFSLFESWDQTRDNPLPTFGLWALMCVASFAVSLVAFFLIYVLGRAGVGGLGLRAFAAMRSGVLGVAGPLVAILVQWIVWTLQTVILFATPAEAYRRRFGSDAVVEVF